MRIDAEGPRFYVRFWGVRGSYPTPGLQTLRHGGNTACVEIGAGKRIIIFDAGSGIIRLGEELKQRSAGQDTLNLSLFITHAHGDHLLGFPFFAPLFDSRTSMHLFGPQLAGKNVEELVTLLMSPPYFPVDVRSLPSRRCFHTITDEQSIRWLPQEEEPLISQGKIGPTESGEVRITARFTRSHPLNGAIIYKVEYEGKQVVYATDVEWGEGREQEILDFIEGADVLIHDAQYTAEDYQHMKHGYGHSTVDMATDIATHAHVRELVLFHHEPTYDDDQLDKLEESARNRFERTRSAYEGMQIDLLA